MSNEAWRISYQSDEQAARAAFKEVELLRSDLVLARQTIDAMQAAYRVQVSDYQAEANAHYALQTGWLRAIDEALVVAHIGVANESDTYEQAKAKLDNLIGFHVDVATDPAVNGGWKLVPIEPTPSVPKLRVGNLPTLNQDAYPALGAWWVQLWNGDDVFARAYGSTPEEAHNRAEMLAAAPEAKP